MNRQKSSCEYDFKYIKYIKYFNIKLIFILKYFIKL